MNCFQDRQRKRSRPPASRRNRGTSLCRNWCQPLQFPDVQRWSVLRTSLLIIQLGPRRVGSRLRKLLRTSLLVGEEQLGHQMGSERIHHDVERQGQQLWYCHWRRISSGIIEDLPSLITAHLNSAPLWLDFSFIFKSNILCSICFISNQINQMMQKFELFMS